jgi:TATA-box binding protein (TBP) (component of TFIID and TFIIIB)
MIIFLLFGNGKIVVTGIKSKDELTEALDVLEKTLSKHK